MIWRRQTGGAGQRGFTLVEMLVGLAIFGAIAGAVTGTTMQVMARSASNDAHLVAVKQVENAIHRLSRDVQMAQVVTPGGISGFPLVLGWTDWNNVSHTVTYSISGAQLRRTEAGVTAVAANGLTGATCAMIGPSLNFSLSVTARHGTATATESRVCEIMPRPTEQ